MAKEVHDEQYCLGRLEHYESQLDKLMNLLTNSPRVIGSDADLTRALYTSVKADLRREAKAGDTQRGRATLTDAERIWYQPHIVQAATELRTPTNAKLGQQMFDDVAQTHVTIHYALFQLRGHLGITPKER